ncbi:uncharacterized protein N7483_003590 [Penicillium malachiteum]|uniref:uncharacterized protein n=1 Tax=Penicillium malachiteum TaxID=1324776 RepID=UPI002548114B|nr:uncharacterized protein N7483_003590 [Penicillium malachiteum]KAJ5729082.1 hypothetical protein N7483_003590 [Penicillium malachiteum]
MPDLITSIDYLADLELYKTEKPYAVVVSPENHDESIETNNLVFESREGLTITDIRGHENDISLETSGFTVTPNKSQLSNVESWDEIRAYQKETEQFLKDWFQADSVFCFDLKLRKNEPVTRLVKDLRDWTIPDAPAYGAHNDVTFDSGPMIIDNNLPTDLKEKYLQPGYRFRIVK